MTIKSRIQQCCIICGSYFEIKPSNIKSIVTCSKACSSKRRSLIYKGKILSKETKEKISKSNMGKKNPICSTPEHRAKVSAGMKAAKLTNCWKGKKLPEETKRKMSESRRGHSRRGWKLSEETRRRYSLLHKGEKSGTWKGGITNKNIIIRQSVDYKLWREAVFKRDNYTCQECNIKGGKIQAHHLKSFAKFPELRFDISNGQTLCIPCHKKTDTYLKRALK